MRNTKHFVILTLILMAVTIFTPSNQSVEANTTLPASDWYAVIWNRTTDTLHWVNSATEQASMARPKLPGEGQQGVSLYISPNGRWLMIHGPLQSGRDGLGFYDLENGQFIQTHEAEQGESIIISERNPFTLNSEYAAVGLSGPNGWRVIAFETATGDAIGQLSAAHPDVPADFAPVQAVPSIALYDLEQNFGQWRVHVRFITLGPNQNVPHQPSLMWMPESNMVGFDSFDPNLTGFDVLPVQGRVVYTVQDQNAPADTNVYTTVLTHLDNPTTLFDAPGAFVTSPRWVANGLMVAFRVTQQPYATMWHLMPAVGGESIPFGPDYDELLGTVDGFILVDYEGGEVKFSNTLAFEPYTPTVGNVIYTTDAPAFSVVYVTPMGATFELESLADSPVVVAGPDEIQAPAQTCGTAPAPRLTVGGDARVTFTDGSPLNIRTAAAGEQLMQIPEGTFVNVVGGPICADNYFWWNLQFESEGATVGGWAAEGDSSAYYLEPVAVVAPPEFSPTATPGLTVATAKPPRADTDCSQAPPEAQLTVGEYARTASDLNGTLAMRTNLSDEFPSHQLPANQTVMVEDGPRCRQGFRMWQVSLTLNNQPVTGWVADGLGTKRYLLPGPARAQ